VWTAYARYKNLNKFLYLIINTSILIFSLLAVAAYGARGIPSLDLLYNPVVWALIFAHLLINGFVFLALHGGRSN
jgi:hypothetical protein